jgi:hypothetical protein
MSFSLQLWKNSNVATDMLEREARIFVIGTILPLIEIFSVMKGSPQAYERAMSSRVITWDISQYPVVAVSRFLHDLRV